MTNRLRSALASCLFLLGCSTADVSVGVPVADGDTLDERVDIARAFATDTRVAWLVEEVRQRYPWLSQEQVGTLRLTVSPSPELPQVGDAVQIFVSMRDTPVRASDAVAYCAELMARALTRESEMRARGPRRAKER
jgi:hypothetical protein